MRSRSAQYRRLYSTCALGLFHVVDLPLCRHDHLVRNLPSPTFELLLFSSPTRGRVLSVKIALRRTGACSLHAVRSPLFSSWSPFLCTHEGSQRLGSSLRPNRRIVTRREDGPRDVRPGAPHYRPPPRQRAEALARERGARLLRARPSTDRRRQQQQRTRSGSPPRHAPAAARVVCPLPRCGVVFLFVVVFCHHSLGHFVDAARGPGLFHLPSRRGLQEPAYSPPLPRGAALP